MTTYRGDEDDLSHYENHILYIQIYILYILYFNESLSLMSILLDVFILMDLCWTYGLIPYIYIHEMDVLPKHLYIYNFYVTNKFRI